MNSPQQIIDIRFGTIGQLSLREQLNILLDKGLTINQVIVTETITSDTIHIPSRAVVIAS